MIRNDKQYLQVHKMVMDLTRTLDQTSDDEALWVEQYLDMAKARLEAYDLKYAADRKGPWMPTYSCRRFWILDPRPGDFEITDIARGLSRIKRFLGQTEGDGFSVAQHCMLVSELLPPEMKLAGLMHDATEPYIGDVITPVKKFIDEPYRTIEDNIMEAIAVQYGFRWDKEVKRKVKWADLCVLLTEVRDLVPCGTYNPAVSVSISEYGAKPLDKKIVPYAEDDFVEKAFLETFEWLSNEAKQVGTHHGLVEVTSQSANG